MIMTPAYAALTAEAPLTPFRIERREPGPNDVLIRILYCGICHSDISYSRGHFPGTTFPLVPGHEIVGQVMQTGMSVTRYRAGDVVGVGCMVDSCRTCADCQSGNEQYCDEMVTTYSGVERQTKRPTFGGYSAEITVDEHFVLKLPAQLDPAAAAPLLCAGITTYSPLRHWGVGEGSRIAVVGLGGLGHLAVKIGVAMGAEVTVLSRSDAKRADAIVMGASDYAAMAEQDTAARLANRFDLILNTVSGNTDTDALLHMLKRDGALVLLGVPETALVINPHPLLMRRKKVAGSLVGGIQETQEMLDLCAQHGIAADIETIRIDAVNDAYTRILQGDIRYRFVIDMQSLR